MNNKPETITGVCPRCKIEGDSSEKILYKCPYCGEYFCEKHRHPVVSMSFKSYQDLIKAYPNLRDMIEEEWRKEGHPCIQYTEHFWEQIKRKEKEELERMEKLLVASRELQGENVAYPSLSLDVGEIDVKKDKRNKKTIGVAIALIVVVSVGLLWVLFK